MVATGVWPSSKQDDKKVDATNIGWLNVVDDRGARC
jgi:hypothetical protein